MIKSIQCVAGNSLVCNRNAQTDVIAIVEAQPQPVVVQTYNEKGHFTIDILQPFRCSATTLSTYNCTICSFKTHYFLSLNKHISQVHRDSDFECHYFQRRHCWLCDFKTYSLLLLLKHFSKHHFKHLKDKKFKIFKWLECEQCSYMNPLLSPLKKHIYARHVRPENFKWFKYKMLPVEIEVYNSQKWYYCDECSYTTKRKFELEHHKSTEHPIKEKLWHCDYCPFQVKAVHELRSHVWNFHQKLFILTPDQFRNSIDM